ncbi:MAG: DUF4166 domain-containing protein [Pseudomonadota bacterium]
MKVIVLGGYGVFGAKLVTLLSRDGHDVVVAGRSADKAQALAVQVGARTLVVDRQGDLAALWKMRPNAVVDAAGPFHAYGDDPYRLARECIKNGVHYLDLADDPAFCVGVSALDEAARAAGVFAISGASSVPAISSVLVAHFAARADEIDMISTAIVPGNRAPRGRAVIESILNQCGRPFEMRVAGKTVATRSWSRPARVDLAAGIRRRAWLMEVPDNRLFGAVFGARTVIFRAGMELGVMNYALGIISWLRGYLRFGMPGWFVTLSLWIAARLLPFGTDIGGMVVAVTTRQRETWSRTTWRMVATAGEGPYIPAVMSRVILRDPSAIAVGARPALTVVSYAQLQDGMSDLAVTTRVMEEKITPLFARFLGGDFAHLPQTVQQAHRVPAPRRLTGRARVTRGTSLWARGLAAIFRFPRETDDIAVSVLMTPEGNGETWERQFGKQTFRSHLRMDADTMTERFGPFTFTLNLHVAAGALHFPVAAGRLGPVPLPRFLLPISIAREFETDGRFHFDVRLQAPLTGSLMVHYQGWLDAEDAVTPQQLKSAVR